MPEQPALFAGYDSGPADLSEQLSAGQRLTARQHRQVAAGVHPLTGARTRPDLGTCGDCVFRRLVANRSRSYPKCSFGADPTRRRVADYWPRASKGAASDVRAWWPACPDHKAA